MLKEVKVHQFWSRLPSKRLVKKDSDIQKYTDADTGVALGYLNTFVRRYFLVEKDEGEKDLAVVKAAQLPKVAKEAQKKERKEKATVDVFAKYPHAIAGTMVYDEKVKKNKVKIKCTLCGDTERLVATQDLFQVKCCVACQTKKKEIRSAKPTEVQIAPVEQD